LKVSLSLEDMIYAVLGWIVVDNKGGIQIDPKPYSLR
jgi:hypothetical protein